MCSVGGGAKQSLYFVKDSKESQISNVSKVAEWTVAAV